MFPFICGKASVKPTEAHDSVFLHLLEAVVMKNTFDAQKYCQKKYIFHLAVNSIEQIEIKKNKFVYKFLFVSAHPSLKTC